MEEHYKISYKMIIFMFQMNGKKTHLIIVKKIKMKDILNNIVKEIIHKKTK